MNHVELMHILQPIRNVNQLNGTSVGLLRDQVRTYELGAIHTRIPLNKLVDISMVHPL